MLLIPLYLIHLYLHIYIYFVFKLKSTKHLSENTVSLILIVCIKFSDFEQVKFTCTNFSVFKREQIYLLAYYIQIYLLEYSIQI